MKNVGITGYTCSRMQLTESIFSMCIDENCCTYWIYTCSRKLTESSFSMCIDEKCCTYWIYICSRMQLTVQVVLLCALMKNVSRTEYICSRMKLTESS